MLCLPFCNLPIKKVYKIAIIKNKVKAKCNLPVYEYFAAFPKIKQ